MANKAISGEKNLTPDPRLAQVTPADIKNPFQHAGAEHAHTRCHRKGTQIKTTQHITLTRTKQKKKMHAK